MTITTEQKDIIEQAIMLLDDNPEATDDGLYLSSKEVCKELYQILLELIED